MKKNKPINSKLKKNKNKKIKTQTPANFPFNFCPLFLFNRVSDNQKKNPIRVQEEEEDEEEEGKERKEKAVRESFASAEFVVSRPLVPVKVERERKNCMSK